MVTLAETEVGRVPGLMNTGRGALAGVYGPWKVGTDSGMNRNEGE